jgi:uncharacterized protein YycO
MITIVFTKPKDKLITIGSCLIRCFLGTKYSHVAIVFTKPSGKKLVYEAVGSGVRYISFPIWEKHVEIVDSVNLSQDEYNQCNSKIMGYCMDNAGMDYGFMQNIGVFIAKVFDLKKNPFKKGKNCSEVLAEILVELGYEVTKPFDLVTPKDINDILKSPSNISRK